MIADFQEFFYVFIAPLIFGALGLMIVSALCLALITIMRGANEA